MSLYPSPEYRQATPLDARRAGVDTPPAVSRPRIFNVITPSKTLKADTVIISDIHLGSEVSRAGILRKALSSWFPFRRLIILGDLFEELDFNLLTKSHFEVIDDLRELSACNDVTVDWIEGNHDEDGDELIERLIGANAHKQMTFDLFDKRYHLIHGHQFDDFLNNHPKISFWAGNLYTIVQNREGQNRRLSRWLKQQSKAWLKVCQKVERDAIEHAAQFDVDYILCGHTHYYDATRANPDSPIRYVNTGCWTDYPCTLTTICDEHGLRQHTYY